MRISCAPSSAYQSAGSSATDIDLSAFYAAAVGSNVSPGVFTSPDQPAAIALLLLGGEALGAFQQTGDLISQAIAAYNTAKGW